MTADIITTYTFGQSYDLLSKPKESQDFLKAFQFTFRLLWLLREIPFLSMLVRLTGLICGAWIPGRAIIPTLLRWQRGSITLILNRDIPLRPCLGHR